MHGARHRVHRQVLELAGCTSENADRLQSEVRQIFYRRLIPAIARSFDRVSSPERILRLDRVEIDLGPVQPDQLEAALVNAFESRFEVVLRRALDESPASDPADSAVELLVRYCTTGTLPWWVGSADRRVVERAVSVLSERQPDGARELVRTLSSAGAWPTAVGRLVAACRDEEVLAAFAAAVWHPSPWSARSIAARGERLVAAAARLRGLTSDTRDARTHERTDAAPATGPASSTGRGRAAVTSTALRRAVWSSLLTVAARLGHPESNRRPDRVMRDWCDDLGARLSIVPRLLIQAGLNRGEVHRASPMGRSRTATSGSAGLSPPPHDGGAERADSNEEAPPAAFSEEPRAAARGDRATSQPRDTDARPGPADRMPTGHPARSERPASAAVSSARADGFAPGVQPHARGDQSRAPQRRSRASTVPAMAVDAIEVHNAGLVVLWPFLVPFFGQLGLLDGRQFRDPGARERAVLALQFAGTGDADPPEFEVPLTKVLCGLAPDEPLLLDQSLSETDLDVCHDMLTAAIHQAPILREMSIGGFRGSFLIREGQLRSRDGHYLLRVVGETHDIVLKRFPWSVGIVKLPWMPSLLHVEWP